MNVDLTGTAGLERAVQLGARMLEAARSRDWASVACLQPQCDALIRQGDFASEYAREALPELQRQHQHIMQMAGDARDEVATELGRQLQTHRALSAYLDLSDGD